MQTLVVALGAGLAVWGVINLLEGYGSDNPGAKSQGIKQLMAGGGVILLGTTLVPMLSSLF
ncbi:Maff2 family protein [Clostridium sp. MSTE9]|nr:Maff2 family protein [Clostridium sp. MSTE9]